MVDGRGRIIEVIVLNRGHGPQPWYRVSWNRILLGRGYYRRVEDALRHVDVASLVEVIDLPPRPRQEPTVSDLDAARDWAAEITAHTEATGWLPEDVTARAAERGELCGVVLDLAHPDTDLPGCVVASHAGWIVAYDHDAEAWTAR